MTDTTGTFHHVTHVHRIASMWPSPEPQPGYVAECAQCGRVGAPTLAKTDALAIAVRHQEYGN